MVSLMEIVTAMEIYLMNVEYVEETAFLMGIVTVMETVILDAGVVHQDLQGVIMLVDQL